LFSDSERGTSRIRFLFRGPAGGRGTGEINGRGCIGPRYFVQEWVFWCVATSQRGGFESCGTRFFRVVQVGTQGLTSTNHGHRDANQGFYHLFKGCGKLALDSGVLTDDLRRDRPPTWYTETGTTITFRRTIRATKTRSLVARTRRRRKNDSRRGTTGCTPTSGGQKLHQPGALSAPIPIPRTFQAGRPSRRPKIIESGGERRVSVTALRRPRPTAGCFPIFFYRKGGKLKSSFRHVDVRCSRAAAGVRCRSVVGWTNAGESATGLGSALPLHTR